MEQSMVSVQDLYRLVTLSDPRFSPDGRQIAFVRTTIDRESDGYKSAIWLAAADGGRLRPFTGGEKRDTAPRWSPDGRWLAFLSNRGGEKAKTQIYLIPTDGGEARRLIEMENGAEEPVWSPNGRRLAFVSRLDAEEMAAEEAGEPEEPLDPEARRQQAEEKEKQEKEKTDPRVIRRFAYRAGTDYLDGRTRHLYVVDVDPLSGEAQGKPRRLTHDDRDYHDPHWLPDGRALIASVERQPGVDDLFVYPDLVRVPLDGGEPQLLTGPQTADVAPRPSPDGRWIAYHSLPAAEYTSANAEIMLLPVEGGEPRALTADLDAHPRDTQWSPDSRSLYFLVAERGRIDLRRVSLEGGPVETVLTADREMMAFDLSADGQQAAFVAAADRDPSALHVADLAGGERQLLAANAEWLAERKSGAVEDFWFESGDGTPIQGWLIKPPDFDPNRRYPLILSIHGGPHVMWSRHEPTMWHEWQVQAAAGYIVLACNPRGSDGYGRAFRTALHTRWGEADLPDLMAGVEAAVAKGFVDPARLFVTGGSYGGFMTAWVIGHNDRFRAAVAQRGVYDLSGFYSTSDIPRLIEWEFDHAPWEDPALLWKYSPLAYAEQIHTPLLLLHAEHDFRAPIPTAEGLFVALRRLKRPVEMVRYPRDGHELSRSGEPKHRVDRLERILAWFERWDQ